MNELNTLHEMYITMSIHLGYLSKSVVFVQVTPGQWHDARDVGAMTFRCLASRRSWSRSAAQRLTVPETLRWNMLPLSIKDDEYKPAKFNLFVKLSGWFR